MTNKELQELLKQYPDDTPIYVPWDREGGNFQHTVGLINKKQLAEKYEYMYLGDIEHENGIVLC